VHWAWSGRVNLYNRQILVLPRNTTTYETHSYIGPLSGRHVPEICTDFTPISSELQLATVLVRFAIGILSLLNMPQNGAEVYDVSSNILIYFFHFCWLGIPEYIYFDKLSQGIVMNLCLLKEKFSQVVYIDQVADLETGHLYIPALCYANQICSNMFRYSKTLNCSKIWPVHAAGI